MPTATPGARRLQRRAPTASSPSSTRSTTSTTRVSRTRLELEAIYERHADADRARERAGARRGRGRRPRASASSGGSRCEGYLGKLTREHAEKLAELEAELEATVDGETVPFRMLRPAMANEPDRGRRERLDRAMCATATEEHLNPVYLDGVEVVQRRASRARRADLRRALRALRLPARRSSPRSAATFLDSTEQLYEERLDRLLPRARSASARRRCSAGTSQRLLRSPQWDERLPGRRRWCRRSRATLADLGIDLDCAGERQARHRAAAEEDAARVLRRRSRCRTR